MQRDERRVLDPGERAELAHARGGYDVIAGAGRVWRETYNDAYVTAYLHNTRNGHDVLDDRRKS